VKLEGSNFAGKERVDLKRIGHCGGARFVGRGLCGGIGLRFNLEFGAGRKFVSVFVNWFGVPRARKPELAARKIEGEGGKTTVSTSAPELRHHREVNFLDREFVGVLLERRTRTTASGRPPTNAPDGWAGSLIGEGEEDFRGTL